MWLKRTMAELVSTPIRKEPQKHRPIPYEHGGKAEQSKNQRLFLDPSGNCSRRAHCHPEI